MITISVQDDDQVTEVAIAEGMTLLAGLEAAGSDAVPVGCRGGGCGACRVNVLSGDYDKKKMSRAHVSEAEEKAGMVLACRTLPKSDLRIVLATPPTIVNQQRKTQATFINSITKEV